MSESGYYPPGAEHDPRAPYNEREGEECPDCEGRGKFLLPTDDGEMEVHDPCERCDGTGVVDPPTREEIKERMDEERFDRMRDEGEI